MHPYYIKLAFILLLSLSGLTYAHHAALVVEEAWIAEAPPVSRVMVAYLTLKNTSNDDIKIVSATSTSYSSIEFHETVHTNGLAKMIRHPSLVVPAESSVQLKRGGKHLMLFNPQRSLRQGDEVAINFSFADGSKSTIKVDVKKAQF